MKTRILVGIGLVFLLAAMFLLGPWFRAIAFTAAALISIYEMDQVFRVKGHRICTWPLYAIGALYGLAFLPKAGLSALGLCLLLCPLALCAERVFNPRRTMEDIICSLFVCIYPLGFYVMLAMVASHSACLLLLCFTAPLLGDTAAYFIGSALGKHKLCPHISPKKTVEGSVGGFFGGALGGLLAYAVGRYVPGVDWGLLPALGQALVLGLICGGIGQIGDLFASTIKRWAGIKDYGKIFPGHGGMMDRLDSVLMCGPVVYLCMALALGL